MRRWLRKQLQSGVVDIVHNHGLWMMPNVYAGLAARAARRPIVVSPRGTLSAWAFGSGSLGKRAFWPMVQRPALRATACFHATAESECEDIRRLGFRQPVAVIPNGIDVPALPPKVTSHTRTLLFLGRIHPKKGLDMLLPAWAAVQARFPDWQLQIVGPDDRGYLEVMRRRAAELHVERTEFNDALYGELKWQAYRRADLFVLPTYSENFGMCVAESLAAATPVIVTKGAPWDALERQRAGWWIEIGVDSLVGCLELAMACPPSVLAEMGARGRAWMQREFGWGPVGRKMARTYEWMLKGGQAPVWIRES